mgnify:CR=1 FL=1
MIDWLTRRVWGLMLLLMRQPWIKRLQHRAIKLVPTSRRLAAIESQRKQNLFALNYGRRILYWTFTLCWWSIVFTAMYHFALTFASELISNPLPDRA